MQENLALYRLDSYEYLFAQDAEKAADAKAADDIAVQMRAELKNLQTLFPEGEGRQTRLRIWKKPLTIWTRNSEKCADWWTRIFPPP